MVYRLAAFVLRLWALNSMDPPCLDALLDPQHMVTAQTRYGRNEAEKLERRYRRRSYSQKVNIHGSHQPCHVL